MKIIKFIKKNYKRFFVQVVSIISSFVIFSVSASADTFDYSIDMPISKPNVSENLFYIEVLYNNGSSGELDIISVTDTQENSYKEQPEILVKYSNDSITLYPSWSYYKVNCFWITSVGNCGTYNSYNSADNAITISFSNIIGIKLYGNFSLESSSQPLPNRFSWNFNYSTSAITTNQLDTIIGLLQSQNSSNNQINDSIQDSTDQILNGGDEPPPVDNSIVNQHNQLEDQLKSQTENGMSSAKNLFNSAGLDLNFGSSLLAITNIINCFAFDGTWLSSVIDVSLLFGLFAFVVGMSLLVINRKEK